VRPAVALRRPTHSDTDQTQNAPVWPSDRLISHRHTRHDKTVLSVSCLAWRCELALVRISETVRMLGVNSIVTSFTLAARSAEDRVQSGSADIQSPQHLDAVVPPSPNPGLRTRPQPAIDHYGAVPTFHDDNICETRFSMLFASCLELTTESLG